MSYSVLPVELLHEIVDSLADQPDPSQRRRDLLAFSKLNATAHTVAQRALFRTIFLFAPKYIQVVDVLEHNPRLALYVRSFTLITPRDFQPQPAFYRSLSTALANMRDLESLKLTIDADLSWVLPDAPELRYPRLRDFSCVFNLDHHVTQFLGRTPALDRLTLKHDSPPIQPIPELPPSALPRLSYFAGASQAALAIVPGRPVSSVSMFSGDLTEDIVDGLAKSTAAVTFLDATTASLPLPLLAAMTVAFPELKELSLGTTHNLWDAYYNTPFIQNIHNALEKMNRLQSALIFGMLWRWVDKDGRVLEKAPKIYDNLPPIPASSSSFFA